MLILFYFIFFKFGLCDAKVELKAPYSCYTFVQRIIGRFTSVVNVVIIIIILLYSQYGEITVLVTVTVCVCRYQYFNFHFEIFLLQTVLILKIIE